jgi:hypothetical protein
MRIIPDMNLLFQESTADGLVVKKEPPSDSDVDVKSPQSEADCLNMRDENTEYQVPLACVEVHDHSKVIHSL